MSLKWYVDRMDIREEGFQIGYMEGRANGIAAVLEYKKSAAKTAELLHCPIEEILAVARDRGIPIEETTP